MEGVRNILVGSRNRLVGSVYRDVIGRLFEEEFEVLPRIFIGHSCDELVQFFEREGGKPDYVFIDFDLEASRDKRFLNGLDLAVFVRNKFPRSKILFLCYKANVFLVKTLIHEVNPNGILEKKDLTPELLEECVKIVMKGGLYYGKRIKEKHILFLDSEYFLDEWDRKLLYGLSMGANRTQLAEELPFSVSTIARRKRRLKEYFGLDTMNDRALVEKAREMGFL